MEWEFTADDVLHGKVSYGLKEFRIDLFQEVRQNLSPDAHPKKARQLSALVYDMYYWLASGRELEEFQREINGDPILVASVRMAARHSKPNVEMLSAIRQRTIITGVKSGLPLEQALEGAAVRHAKMTGVTHRSM